MVLRLRRYLMALGVILTLGVVGCGVDGDIASPQSAETADLAGSESDEAAEPATTSTTDMSTTTEGESEQVPETVMAQPEAIGTLFDSVLALDPLSVSVEIVDTGEYLTWTPTGWVEGEADPDVFFDHLAGNSGVDPQVDGPQDFTWRGHSLLVTIGGEGTAQIQTSAGADLTTPSERIYAFKSSDTLAFGTATWGNPSARVGTVEIDKPESQVIYQLDAMDNTHLVGVVRDRYLIVESLTPKADDPANYDAAGFAIVDTLTGDISSYPLDQTVRLLAVT